MMTFEFMNSEGGFAKRTNESLIRNLIISILFSLIVGLLSEWTSGLAIGLIVFLVQYFKSKRWDKAFIDKITFDENSTTINFTDENTPQILNGNLNDFLFKKKVAFNK